MPLKTIVKDVLLLFVGASLGIGLMDTIRPAVLNEDTTPKALIAENPTDGRLIAYYFHGKHRCDTCKTIEAYSHDALQQNIEEGQLGWITINYDLPANKHFRKDFKIVAPTLVLVREEAGGSNHWKNLDQVWQHTDDKPAFVQYVQKELESFRQAQP